MKTLTIPQGQIVFKEGDTLRGIYKIIRGKVEIYVNYGTPEKYLLLTKGEGQMFGEMSAICDNPRSATVVTTEDCEFELFEEADFIDLLKNNFGLLNEIQIMLAVEFDQIIKRYLACDFPTHLHSEYARAICKKAFEQHPDAFVQKLRDDIDNFKFIQRKLAYGISTRHTRSDFVELVGSYNKNE